jgi:hypothetical protein
MMFSLIELKPGVLLQVKEKLDTASLGVGVDATFEFTADEALKILEELYGENEGGLLLLLGVGRRNYVVRTAIALGDGNHAVVLPEHAPFGTANLIEAAASELDCVVVLTNHAIWDKHIDFATLS